jgi:ABC-2 type transport system permease protein
MPDLQESSPSKIASGFGGTLSLVISALFIIAVVLVTAIPAHLFLATEGGSNGSRWAWAGSRQALAAGVALATLLGLAATSLPLALGLRAFRRLEP